MSEPPPLVIDEASAAATTPHVRAQITFNIRDGATYTFWIHGGPPYREVKGHISAGWLEGKADSFTWQQPDRSGLAGWSDGWALVDDVEVEVEMTEIAGEVDPMLVLPPVPPSRQVDYTAVELEDKGVTIAAGTTTLLP